MIVETGNSQQSPEVQSFLLFEWNRLEDKLKVFRLIGLQKGWHEPTPHQAHLTPQGTLMWVWGRKYQLSLLFTADVVLLAFADYDLWRATKCKVSGMIISSWKSAVLKWRMVGCSQWSVGPPFVKTDKNEGNLSIPVTSTESQNKNQNPFRITGNTLDLNESTTVFLTRNSWCIIVMCQSKEGK